jgi:hypothetical protein
VTIPYELPPLWSEALANEPDWVAAIEMGIDVILLEENLRLTPAERICQLVDMQVFADAIQHTAKPR